MAPPSSRRPGFSRRAQYGLFIGYVVAVAGILLALLLLAIAIIDPRGFAALRGAAIDGTAPATEGSRSIGDFVRGIGTGIGDYFRAGSQNAELRAEVERMRNEVVRAQAIDFENRRLRHLLGLAGQIEDEVTIARVVGSSFSSNRRYATLSAGSQSGVLDGMPVRAPEGLIGRVLETGRWAARVLLVTDGSSSVPVRLVRDGTPALAVGRGDGTIELRTLEVGANPFQVGDVLVTSGIGGIFPPNIPVARVIRLEGDSALARPIADPARADFAIVQRPYQPASEGALQAAPQIQRVPVTVSGQQAQQAQQQPGAQPAAPAPQPRQRSPQYQPALQRPEAAVPQGQRR